MGARSAQANVRHSCAGASPAAVSSSTVGMARLARFWNKLSRRAGGGAGAGGAGAGGASGASVCATGMGSALAPSPSMRPFSAKPICSRYLRTTGAARGSAISATTLVSGAAAQNGEREAQARKGGNRMPSRAHL